MFAVSETLVDLNQLHGVAGLGCGVTPYLKRSDYESEIYPLYCVRSIKRNYKGKEGYDSTMKSSVQELNVLDHCSFQE